ncbi:MAG: ECF transporter S component [Defluviitaleaceae bacterium]|nr:ECF transporter S component [Defluviitaleaceae bacterium]
MNNRHIQNIVLAALFLAIGLVLPFFTGGMLLGRMLLPMHIPVLLCGIMLGSRYGFLVGGLLPIARFLMVQHPAFVLPGLPMVFELAVYGALIGFLYHKLPKTIPNLFISLFAAMIAGRIIWALAMTIIAGVSDIPFSFEIFISDAFINATTGIILQIVLIPTLIIALRKAGWRTYGEQHTR